MKSIDYFDQYTLEFGWRVIPVYPKSKVPVGNQWNDGYSVSAARHHVRTHPNCNLGLLLGDVVDVEGDTPEANDILNELTKDYPHPAYRSNKSIHHLFECPDPQLTSIKASGIEFRGRRHHSVLPPSRQVNGVRYQWVTEPGPVPQMPPGLFDLFQSLKKAAKPWRRPNFAEPTCDACGVKRYVHQKRFDLEAAAFCRLDRKWACIKCRKVDVRDLCRKIRREK